jgi:hypothetical protein
MKNAARAFLVRDGCLIHFNQTFFNAIKTTKKPAQKSQEWLDVRATGISGSEIPKIFNHGYSESEDWVWLFMQKCGFGFPESPPRTTRNEAIEYGNTHEDAALREYVKYMGLPQDRVLTTGCWRVSELNELAKDCPEGVPSLRWPLDLKFAEFLLGSPDAIVTLPNGELCLVEIKCHKFLKFSDTSAIPHYYIHTIVWYALVFRCTRIHLVQYSDNMITMKEILIENLCALQLKNVISTVDGFIQSVLTNLVSRSYFDQELESKTKINFKAAVHKLVRKAPVTCTSTKKLKVSDD